MYLRYAWLVIESLVKKKQGQVSREIYEIENRDSQAVGTLLHGGYKPSEKAASKYDVWRKVTSVLGSLPIDAVGSKDYSVV